MNTTDQTIQISLIKETFSVSRFKFADMMSFVRLKPILPYYSLSEIDASPTYKYW